MIWTKLALDRESPAPLYAQLADRIRDLVRSGQLAPGDQLPPERELAEFAGISRMTARQAVIYLAREGTLSVRHGSGTFVAEPKLTYDALHLLGFTEETLRQGGTVSTRVIEQAVLPAPAAVAEALDQPIGAELIKIVRLRSAGGTPVLLETSWLPRSLCDGLQHVDLATQSLYHLLHTHYDLRLDRARQGIEAVTANEFECDLLDVGLGTPLLLLEGVATAENGRPVECFKAVYRADRVRFELISTRESRSGEAVVASRVSVLAP